MPRGTPTVEPGGDPPIVGTGYPGVVFFPAFLPCIQVGENPCWTANAKIMLGSSATKAARICVNVAA